MTEIKLGRRYRDIITGYIGHATGIANYISGCSQVLLAAKVDKESGSFREPQWFDAQRLEVNSELDDIVLDNGSTPGFDRAAPKR